MSTLLISILTYSLSNPTIQETHEYQQTFSTYSECLQTKQHEEELLTKMNQDSILGYSIKCK